MLYQQEYCLFEASQAGVRMIKVRDVMEVESKDRRSGKQLRQKKLSRWKIQKVNNVTQCVLFKAKTNKKRHNAKVMKFN